MEKHRRRLVGLLVLIVLVLLAARLAPHLAPSFGAQAGIGSDEVDASGVITAQEIVLSSPHGGRIAAFYAAEGDHVEAGQELVVLDTALLEAQIVAREAQLAVAQAGLLQSEAGARPGAIVVAEAQLAQAEVVHQAALQRLADAKALRENPQEVNMHIAVAEIQVEAAEHRLQSAVELKDAAQVAKDVLEYSQDQISNWPFPFLPPKLPEELEAAPYEWWRAWAGVNAASASLQGAQARVAHWRAVLANPQELDAQVSMTQAAVIRAEAAVDAAQAQLDAYKAGASEEQLSVARAHVAQAQVALDALLAQREEMIIIAPVNGIVLSRVSHVGEVAAPGSKLLSLADLTEVKLTVYVAENRLAQIALDQEVSVSVDAFPERTFEGRVLRIADRAQYTPRNVATKEERVNTVYAVEVLLPNADGLLRPGMPADARFIR